MSTQEVANEQMKSSVSVQYATLGIVIIYEQTAETVQIAVKTVCFCLLKRKKTECQQQNGINPQKVKKVSFAVCTPFDMILFYPPAAMTRERQQTMLQAQNKTIERKNTLLSC